MARKKTKDGYATELANDMETIDLDVRLDPQDEADIGIFLDMMETIIQDAAESARAEIPPRGWSDLWS